MPLCRHPVVALSGLLIAMVLTGCGQPTGAAVQLGAARTHEAAGQPDPLPFAVTASIQELMQYEVDPSADAIWDAAGTTLTRQGLVEKQPRSDEDWKALRQHAIVLLEATNLLAIRGRRVAPKEFLRTGQEYSARRTSRPRWLGVSRSLMRLRRDYALPGSGCCRPLIGAMWKHS